MVFPDATLTFDLQSIDFTKAGDLVVVCVHVFQILRAPSTLTFVVLGELPAAPANADDTFEAGTLTVAELG